VEHGRTPSTGEGIRIHTALATYRAGALGWLGGGLVALALAVAVPLPALAVLALVVGGGTAAVIGLGALVRAVRWRRAVAGGDWRPGRLRLAGPVVAALEPEGYDELDPEHRLLQLRLLPTVIWRAGRVQGLDGAAVLATPAGPRRWLLTAPGTGILFGARETGRRS
jgi:hypothetical protein